MGTVVVVGAKGLNLSRKRSSDWPRITEESEGCPVGALLAKSGGIDSF